MQLERLFFFLVVNTRRTILNNLTSLFFVYMDHFQVTVEFVQPDMPTLTEIMGAHKILASEFSSTVSLKNPLEKNPNDILHTHVRTHTHARTHARTRTPTHTHIHTLKCKHVQNILR